MAGLCAEHIVQVLHISNGNTINEKLKVRENRLGKLLDVELSDSQLIEHAYLCALARYPSDAEKQRLLKLLLRKHQQRQKKLPNRSLAIVQAY